MILEALCPSRAQDWAARLNCEFGSIAAVMNQSPEALMRVIEDTSAASHLNAIGVAWTAGLRSELASAPVLANSVALRNYLHATMAHLTSERLRVLFLNAGNHLIRDEVLSSGSVTEVAVYPREVLKRALELGADSLILVHNHPSGSLDASAQDVEITKRIVEGAKSLDIAVHDHLIVGKGGLTSFRSIGLM